MMRHRSLLARLSLLAVIGFASIIPNTLYAGSTDPYELPIDNVVVISGERRPSPPNRTVYTQSKRRLISSFFALSSGDIDWQQAVGLRVDVENAANCGGTNSQRQIVTAEFDSGEPDGYKYLLDVTVRGAVETQDSGFDLVYVNGVFFFGGEDWNGGCRMVTKTVTKRIQVQGGDKLTLKYDTVDGLYHVGAYAEIIAIRVYKEEIDHIKISPDPAYVRLGGSQQFVARGYNEAGIFIRNVEATWSPEVVKNIDGDIIGTLDATTGKFTAAREAGTGTITAKYVRADEKELTDTAEVFVVEVESITASSNKADNSPQVFEEFKADFGDPCSFQNPGQALIIFFKDVINSNLNVQPFDVRLQAKIKPQQVSDADLPEVWSKSSKPDSGSFDKTDTFDVKLQGLKGGLHKIKLIVLPDAPESGANILLPLSGAEVKDRIEADLKKADAWATKINAKYSKIEKYFRAIQWFFIEGDYAGRPNNSAAPTCIRFNTMDNLKRGAVGTWFGVPVRVSKYSNFIVAYSANKINLSKWWFFNVGTRFGTPDDKGSEVSTQAGWDIAGGASYEQTMKTKVKEIFEGTEDSGKTQRLWPNLKPDQNNLLLPLFLK